MGCAAMYVAPHHHKRLMRSGLIEDTGTARAEIDHGRRSRKIMNRLTGKTETSRHSIWSFESNGGVSSGSGSSGSSGSMAATAMAATAMAATDSAVSASRS